MISCPPDASVGLISACPTNSPPAPTAQTSKRFPAWTSVRIRPESARSSASVDGPSPIHRET